MKYSISCFLIIFSWCLYAQERNLDKEILDLKVKISQADNAKKLQLTDTLITLVEFNEAHNYSSLIKDNIALALRLDSIDIATKHTADFIYYHNAVLGKVDEGLQIFKAYEGKESKGKKIAYMINLYKYGSDSYLYSGNYTAAIKALKKGGDYAALSKNKQKIASVTLRLGTVQVHSGQFTEASKNLQNAAKIFLEVQDTIQFLNTNNVLSVLYSQNDFFEEARKLREDAIELSKQTTGKPFLIDLYYNNGADYRMRGDYKNWIENLKLASIENEKSEQKQRRLPIILSDLAIAAAITDSIPLAEKYLAEFKNVIPSYDTGFNRTYYIEVLKQLSFAKKNYTAALQYGKEHLNLKRQENSFVEISNAEKFMADVYKALGDKNKENEHLVFYYKIKDSISSVKNVQNLSYYQTIFETERRDFKIEAQKNDIALLKEREKVRSQWYIIGAVLLVGIFGILWLLRSRNFARNKQKLQENFTKDILKTQENERARIASELHDSVGQKLLILKNSLAGKNEDDKKEIDLVRETIKEVREMSHNLHPFQFEKLGLVQSLKNMVETFQKNSNIFYSEEIEIPENFIAKEKEIYIFRMLQEGMTNVEKHSKATACNLTSTTKKESVVFTLKDNGKGFNINKNANNWKGLGLKTLEERARFIGAKLLIDATANNGTILTLKISKK